MILDDATDWAEVAELLIVGYVIQAPARLASRIALPESRPGPTDPSRSLCARLRQRPGVAGPVTRPGVVRVGSERFARPHPFGQPVTSDGQRARSIPHLLTPPCRSIESRADSRHQVRMWPDGSPCWSGTNR